MNLQLFEAVIVEVFMAISVSIFVLEIETFQGLAVEITPQKNVSVVP